ncbi:hypothetical protein RB653_009322 [Dictyostelium firmibasis]|uniref:Uncharacterized protein n=1 Tax=Dictyostelium firmibasis TaxID=79012 RepID=A0AAN7YXA7_9MYCE
MEEFSKDFVWYITGCSQGFGFILTVLLIKRGFKVTATSRNKDNFEKKIFNNDESKGEITGLSKEKHGEQLLICQVDLVNESSVKLSLNDTILKFGRLDVVVNNSGYIRLGAVEELSDKEYRDLFDANFFGMLNVLRNSLPLLREYTKTNGYGGCRVYNISSIAGILNLSAGSSPYSSTKFAMEAISESLHMEMKPHNVHVTCVKPGFFKTNIRDSATSSDKPLDCYSNVRAAVNDKPNWTFNGDPKKAMNILIDLSLDKNTSESLPPLHLFLGPETIDFFNKKVASIQSDLNHFINLTTSTNFD